MNIKKVRCKRDYRFLKPGEVGIAVGKIKTGLYSHAEHFPHPDPTEEEYADLIKEYTDTFSAYKGHTKPMSALQRVLKKLIKATDLLADYVDKQANNNAVIIELAGFKATQQYVGKKNVPEQCTVTVKRGKSRELITNCPKVENADSYGAILTDKPLPHGTYIEDGKLYFSKAAAALQGGVIIFALTKARKKVFRNLEVSVTYYIYYWAGNANGISPLSEVVTKKVVE
jgi:hypothetical protein